jgi:hypothetical protein
VSIAEGLHPERDPFPYARAFHWVGYGRALAQLRGRHDDAVRALHRAETMNPVRVRRNPLVRGTSLRRAARACRSFTVVIVIDLPPEIPHQQPVAARGSNSRAIAVICTQHGSAGLTNLTVSKHDGTIVLDPHVAGSCDHPGRDGCGCPVRPARGMARMSALSSLALSGGPADPHQLCSDTR